MEDRPATPTPSWLALPPRCVMSASALFYPERMSILGAAPTGFQCYVPGVAEATTSDRTEGSGEPRYLYDRS